MRAQRSDPRRAFSRKRVSSAFMMLSATPTRVMAAAATVSPSLIMAAASAAVTKFALIALTLQIFEDSGRYLTTADAHADNAITRTAPFHFCSST
jgi:exo-beta-1,3-glucanase (GH17 family)